MAMRNPVGRANYQPNSWGDGPRESPQRGFRSFEDVEQGPKQRIRAESFADHYSQARQFFKSQNAIEQGHIANALTFELSKVENPAIRERMVAHLLNIDESLAATVAEQLGIKDLPPPADSAVEVRDDLPPSPSLSIIENGPKRFESRKVGVLVSDGADASLLDSLRSELAKEGASMEVIAPKVGGAEAAGGNWIDAKHMIGGGPSVLFDAVAIVVSQEGGQQLSDVAPARDFVADAFAHCKFIAYVEAARPLMEKAGIGDDEGIHLIGGRGDVAAFVQKLAALRFWAREPRVSL